MTEMMTERMLLCGRIKLTLFFIFCCLYFPEFIFLSMIGFPGNYLVKKLKEHGRSTETVMINGEWVLHCVDKQVVGL